MTLQETDWNSWSDSVQKINDVYPYPGNFEERVIEESDDICIVEYYVKGEIFSENTYTEIGTTYKINPKFLVEKH